MLTPALLCHKDTAQVTQSPLSWLDIFCISLFLYGGSKGGFHAQKNNQLLIRIWSENISDFLTENITKTNPVLTAVPEHRGPRCEVRRGKG